MTTAQATVVCPLVSGDPNHAEGCGLRFSAAVDADGRVECPSCGLSFDPDDSDNLLPTD